MAGQASFPAGAAAAEWREHWTLVLAAMLGFSVVGMSIYGLGAFIAPLQAEFHWSRALITSGPMVYAGTSLVSQPFVGRMIDRWGPRRIALIGVVLSAITYALFATATPWPPSWPLLWLVYSISIQLMLTSTWSSAVASQFEAGRGLALAFTLGGSAVAGVAAPNAATWLIAAYGWRAAFVVIGLAVGAIVFVTTWLFFYGRNDRQRSAATAAPAEELPGLTLAEAAREPAFYKLGFGIFSGYVMTIAVLVHMVPILEGDGLQPKQAALLTGLFGLFAMVGKLVCGGLVNRWPGHLITAAMSAVPIAGYLILMAPGQPVWLLALAVALIGTAGGALLKMSVYLATRHFGLRAFATIYGFVGGALTISGGLGPLIGGFMYDRFGDYRLMLSLGIPLSVAAALLMLWLGDYPEVRAARRLARAAG